MKKHLTIIKVISVLVVLAISGCQKQPQAGFSIDKKTVFPGDKVTCTNTSTSGYSYKWISPTGNSYSSKDFDIIAGSTLGEFTVKLEAFSKNGKKESDFSNTFTVIDFYNKSFTGTYFGKVTNSFYNDPTKGILVTTLDNDKIRIDDSQGTGLTLDFTISSTTNGALIPKIVSQPSQSYNFKSGSVSRNGNAITINFIFDYTDSSDPSNNAYNVAVSDQIIK